MNRVICFDGAMKLVALSGGIAAGKSTIARRLESLGAVHIDADQLAREAVEPGSPGLQRVREAFGDEVIAEDGSLDRAALASLVFQHTERLAELNSIVHPEVRRIYEQRLEQIRRDHPNAIVIYDVPLLVEAGRGSDWDLVVIAEAPPSVRIDRMVRLRGMSAEDAAQRISNQVDDEARRAIADVIIDTGGSEDQTMSQVDELWVRLTSDGTHRSSRVAPARSSQ